MQKEFNHYYIREPLLDCVDPNMDVFEKTALFHHRIATICDILMEAEDDHDDKLEAIRGIQAIGVVFRPVGF